MPQGEHIELHRKRNGFRLDYHEKKRKKEARSVHKRAAFAQKALGLKAKMYSKKRHAEKATMKKTIAMHQQRDNKHKAEDGAPQSAVPAYLLEREQVQKPFLLLKCSALSRLSCKSQSSPNLLGNLTKQKVVYIGGSRKGAQQHNQAEEEREGGQMGGSSSKGDLSISSICKFTCQVLGAAPHKVSHWVAMNDSGVAAQVRPVAEDEMFKVLHSGKRKKKAWKRMVTKVTFVGPSFTRKPPKYERFIRPSGEHSCLLEMCAVLGHLWWQHLCPSHHIFGSRMTLYLCRSAYEEGTCDAP